MAIFTKNRSSSIVILLLVKGEFRVFNALVLLSLYGAAILAIPLVLSSFFELSGVTLGLQNAAAFSTLLLSIYSRTMSSYNLVEIALFLGFVITCYVSGMSIGRRMVKLEINFNHLGVRKIEGNRSITGAFLLISLVSTLLSFSFAFVFSSVAIYSVSLLVHGPYLAPSPSVLFWIYLAMLFVISFVALIAGSSRARISSIFYRTKEAWP